MQSWKQGFSGFLEQREEFQAFNPQHIYTFSSVTMADLQT